MATSAPDQTEAIEAILTCSICLEVFDSPRTLLCSHTFCAKCLDAYTKKQLKDGGQQFKCPFCREPCHKNQSIDMKILGEFVELYKIATTNVNVCVLCKTNSPSVKCAGCNIKYICDVCLPQHVKQEVNVPDFRGHVILPCNKPSDFVVEEGVYCEKHTSKMKDLYCKDCKVMVCSTCSSTTHRKHSDIVDIEDALHEMLPVLEKHIAKIEGDALYLEKELTYFKEESLTVDELYKQTKSDLTRTFTSDKLDTENARKRDILSLDQQEAETVDKLQTDYKSAIDSEKRKYMKKLKELEKKHKDTIQKLQKKHKEDIANTKTARIQNKGKIEKQYEKTISDASNHYKHEIALIERNEDSSLENLHAHIEEKTNMLKKKQSLIRLARVTLHNVKGSSLMQALESNLKENIENESKKASDALCVQITIPFKTSCKNSFIYERISKGIYQKFKPGMILRVVNQSFKDMLKKAVKVQDILISRFSYYHRICIVGNNFWIPAHQMVKVYSPTGKKVNEINISSLKYIKVTDTPVFQQVSESDVFMACNNGLFVLDITGQIQYKLEDHHFCDVTTNGKEVVATTLSELYVFTFNGMKWQSLGKMCFEPKENQISKYTLNDIISSMKRPYKTNPDFVYYPINIILNGQTVFLHSGTQDGGTLCSVDKFGNAVLSTKDGVVVLNDRRQKQLHKFPNISNILDIVIIDDVVILLWIKMKNVYHFETRLAMLHP